MKQYLITEDDIAVLRFSNADLRADLLSSLKPIEPLSNGDILKVARAVADKKIDPNQSIYEQFGLEFARAIEAAHGITK